MKFNLYDRVMTWDDFCGTIISISSDDIRYEPLKYEVSFDMNGEVKFYYADQLIKISFD